MPGVKTRKKLNDELFIDKRNIPYKMDSGLGERARIGLIVLSDDQTIEYELRRIFDLPDVVFYVSRIYCAPTITPDTLKDMENEIASAARLILPDQPLDVVAYGCTSGAMLIGTEAVRNCIHESRPGVLCTTPVQATIAAFEALDAGSICLITPYADEINRHMRSYILEHGFRVPVMGSWNEPKDPHVGRISPDSIREAVFDLGRSNMVDAVFLSCTNIRALDIIKEMESELGKPVISSNQAMGWHCLRLAGVEDRLSRFGSLFHHEKIKRS